MAINPRQSVDGVSRVVFCAIVNIHAMNAARGLEIRPHSGARPEKSVLKHHLSHSTSQQAAVHLLAGHPESEYTVSRAGVLLSTVGDQLVVDICGNEDLTRSADGHGLSTRRII